MSDPLISPGRMRFICVLGALANGLVYLVLSLQATAAQVHASIEMLFLCIVFWFIAANFVWESGMSWRESPHSRNESRVLAILLPCAAALNARVAIYYKNQEPSLNYAHSWFVLWIFMSGAMLLTVVQSLPRLEKRLVRFDFRGEGFPYAEWSAVVGSLTMLAATTVQHWPLRDSIKKDCYICDCGSTFAMLTSALCNETLVMLYTGDSSGVKCLMRFLLLQMFLGNFLYRAWAWDPEDYIFLGAAVVQCILLCAGMRHQNPEPASFALSVVSRQSGEEVEAPRGCQSLSAFLDTFRGRHAAAMVNAALNFVLFTASGATVKNDIRNGIICRATAAEHQRNDCTVLKRGTHVLRGATICSAVACVLHAFAIAVDVLERRGVTSLWQIDSSFRWGALLKASLLWMKIVILFYTRAHTGRVDPLSGLVAACAAVSLFVFNVFSMKHIVKAGWQGIGSFRTYSYRIGALLAAFIDAVLILYIACALANVQSFVNALQGISVDKLLFLPCTFLFPIFGLCNELSEAAREHIPLPSGVYVMALQCAFTVPLQMLVNVILPSTSIAGHRGVFKAEVPWPMWLMTLTTIAFVLGGLFIMHGTASSSVTRAYDRSISMQAVA